MMRLQGKVVSSVIAKGSKSERQACILVVGNQRYILRKKGASAFIDDTFDPYVNKIIEVEGSSLGTTFIVENFKVIE